ncbi:MAG: pyridoxine/pyridoxamine 5'-phosphate oxidase [Leptospiraceae bacterium]|nr:MAG: pyridoxine/pyridoxamine 5'-phosphate oxidase [Leptospiraceae bacterium]
MDKKLDLKSIRREYEGPRLLEEEAGSNPFELFQKWFEQALKEEIDPNAMTLATVDENHNPDARIMLLKEVNEKGFIFYTNYHSKKGKDLAQNPKATIVFFWHKMVRQVRIFGIVEKLSEQEAIEYFQQRPFESQVAAYLSKQSEIIENRDEVEKKFHQLLEEFKNKPVPKPESWGGYILIPLKFEFWQGRPARFHDRLLYIRESTSIEEWKRYRLYP